MFESHVTVKGVSIADFIRRCSEIGVKAVVIDGDTGSGKVQMMTAKFHKTNDQDEALLLMHKIALAFPGVVRRKLELIVKKGQSIPSHLYLEFHSKFEVPVERVDEFTERVAAAGGHTSYNALKAPGYYFATSRTAEGHGRIIEAVEGFRMVGTIRECVVYDDNPSLDANWRPCLECPIKLLNRSLSGHT